MYHPGVTKRSCEIGSSSVALIDSISEVVNNVW